MKRLFTLALVATVIACSGCVTIYAPPPEFQQGLMYTQVTFKPYRHDQISHSNFLLSGQVIPAGTPVVVKGVSHKFFILDINGLEFKLRPEQGHAWSLVMAPDILRKFVGPRPPRLPENYTSLIMNPKVIPAGLTRQEVIAVYGYPAYIAPGVSTENLTRDQIMAAENWYYFLNAWRIRARIAFDENGKTLPGGFRR